MNNRLKLRRLSRILTFKGVDVYVHWTVLLIVTIFLAGSIRRPLVTAVALASYLGVLLIHECGHVMAAQRMGCKVWSIELYPIYGITRFDTPWSRFDHCVIAWGGVLAQATVAVPILMWVATFGYTPFEAVNSVLAILGFFSLFVAFFNLLPKTPLDGSIAWGIIPLYIERKRTRRTKRPGGWRTY
jgi:Zn-dependent protease